MPCRNFARIPHRSTSKKETISHSSAFPQDRGLGKVCQIIGCVALLRGNGLLRVRNLWPWPLFLRVPLSYVRQFVCLICCVFVFLVWLFAFPVAHLPALSPWSSFQHKRLAEYGWKPHRDVFGSKKPVAGLNSLVAFKSEGYAFIEFEISNGTISIVFRQPLITVELAPNTTGSSLQLLRGHAALAFLGGTKGVPRRVA